MFGDLVVLSVPTYSPKMSAKLPRSFENEHLQFLIKFVSKKDAGLKYGPASFFDHILQQK